MFALLVAMFLDLKAPATVPLKAPATPPLRLHVDTLAAVSVQLEPTELLVRVIVELKNVSRKTVRVVWQPSGDQPLKLVFNDNEQSFRHRFEQVTNPGWFDLKPGESKYESTEVIIPKNTGLKLRYRVRSAECPAPTCFVGMIESESVGTRN